MDVGQATAQVPQNMPRVTNDARTGPGVAIGGGAAARSSGRVTAGPGCGSRSAGRRSGLGHELRRVDQHPGEPAGTDQPRLALRAEPHRDGEVEPPPLDTLQGRLGRDGRPHHHRGQVVELDARGHTGSPRSEVAVEGQAAGLLAEGHQPGRPEDGDLARTERDGGVLFADRGRHRGDQAGIELLGGLGRDAGHDGYDTARARRPRVASPAGGQAQSAQAEPLVAPPVLERVLAAALARGGEMAEVFAEDRQSSGAVLDDRRVEELSSGRERGAGIRVVVGETTGFAHTADLSEAGLLAAAEAASAVARQGGGGARTVALDARRPASPRAEVLPSGVAKSAKLELLARADEAARSAGDAVSQVQVGYGDSRRRFLVARSDGLFAEDDQVRTRFNVVCVATGDTGMQTGYESVARTLGFEVFDEADVEELARTAATRALSKLSARPAPSGEVPVVLAGGSGGILFHEACGHGLEADHIVKDASVYVGQVGQQVASPLVTLVDDGTVAGEWGTSRSTTKAGRPPQRADRGRRAHRLPVGLAAGPQGGEGVLGQRPAPELPAPAHGADDQHLPPGRGGGRRRDGGPDPHGVYVAKLGGGQVNTATGDFVFGTTEAYLIEGGRITEPLRDANLIGNGPEVLRRSTPWPPTSP